MEPLASKKIVGSVPGVLAGVARRTLQSLETSAFPQAGRRTQDGGQCRGAGVPALAVIPPLDEAPARTPVP